MALQPHTEPDTPREWWPVPMIPLWRAFTELFRDGEGRHLVEVDEYTEDGTLVVRAELPGIDPDQDVAIEVGDGALTIRAERSEIAEHAGRFFHRHELRYGSFVRTLALPQGVEPEEVAASYKDGVLEIRVPLPAEATKTPSRRVPVTRT
ncbi:MAG TPA: Hsp20/alpha crystallin family protein [Acidimicrobiales bacterium]|nr:Hsp20/alpha crystallin family protein [Acidimicrobiales bacterium]